MRNALPSLIPKLFSNNLMLAYLTNPFGWNEWTFLWVQFAPSVSWLCSRLTWCFGNSIRTFGDKQSWVFFSCLETCFFLFGNLLVKDLFSRPTIAICKWDGCASVCSISEAQLKLNAPLSHTYYSHSSLLFLFISPFSSPNTSPLFRLVQIESAPGMRFFKTIVIRNLLIGDGEVSQTVGMEFMHYSGDWNFEMGNATRCWGTWATWGQTRDLGWHFLFLFSDWLLDLANGNSCMRKECGFTVFRDQVSVRK